MPDSFITHQSGNKIELSLNEFIFGKTIIIEA
jgi:hypothetical protein